MTPATVLAERDRLVAAFRLGLGRQGLPSLPGLEAIGDAQRPLAALALAGQLAWLTPPAPAGARKGWRLPDSPMPLVPDRAREALLRLADRLDAVTVRALVPLLRAHVGAAGFRLHPFDFPYLAPLLDAGGRADPVERAWLDRDAAAPTGELDAVTWQDARLPERVVFLRALRGRDPAAGRALLEAAFPNEAAKARGDLLRTLDAGLGPDDRPFLEACAGDRAASVAQAAKALLDALPGSAAHAVRLDAARAAFRIEKEGLLRRRSRLAYKAPTTAQGRVVSPIELLDRIGLADLAGVLGVLPGDLPAMATDDLVRHALAACSLRDGITVVAAKLLHEMGTPLWPGDVATLGAAFGGLDADGRQLLAAAAFRPEASVGGDWRLFGALLDAPMRPELAGGLLRSKAWGAYVTGLSERGKGQADGALLDAAALVPASLARQFTGTVAPLEAAQLPRTKTLLAFLDALAAPPHPEHRP